MTWLVVWKEGSAFYEDEDAERAVERAYIEFKLTSDNCPFYVVNNDYVQPMMIEVQVTAHGSEYDFGA